MPIIAPNDRGAFLLTWGEVSKVATCDLVEYKRAMVRNDVRQKPMPIRSSKEHQCARFQHCVSGVQGKQLGKDQERLVGRYE